MATLLDSNKAERITAVTSGEELGDNFNEPRFSRLLVSSTAAIDDSLSKSTAGTIVKTLDTRPNPLHEYATYTYGWTLYMLTVDEFEKLQTLNTSNAYDWNPSTVIISSAGKYNSTSTNPGRHPEFTDDFYFDDVKITTVIGQNNKTRGTNAIDFSFSIIEPYGLTLLDRLIAAATSSQVGSKNYIDQPYLLELNFYGTTDLGEPTVPISKLKKRFPIKLSELKIKADTKGSVYSVTAYPYNHAAFNEIAVTTPVTLSIAASNLGNFFDSTLSSGDIYAKNQERRKKLNDATVAVADLNNESAAVRAAARENLDAVRNEYAKPYDVQSYAAALNLWFASLVGSEADEADQVEFKFSGFPNNIQSVSIVPPSTPSRNITSPVSQRAAAQSANPGISAQTPVDSANVYNTTISAGTNIIEVINIAMRNSEYIRKQVVDSKSEFRDNVPVDFYKIIPQITKLKYDNKRKRYATKTVYHIVYYQYFNTKHPNLPYCSPSAAVKKYDYMYTGKNLDILDFSIEFNTAYYNTVIAYAGNTDAGNNKVSAPTGNDSTKQRATLGSESDIAQYKSEAIAHNAQDSSNNMQDGKGAVVATAVSSIYASSQGDMISVKMRVIGDPDFIKQDDFYMNPGMADYSSNLVNADGSVAMDFSDVFFDLTFKSPVDMDESTGLIRKDARYTNSKFSGTYRLITVNNEFSRGQFVQNLTAVRMFSVTPTVAQPTTTIRQIDNQIDREKMKTDAEQMLARVPTKDAIALGSRAAHANLGKTPTIAVTEYQAKIKSAAAAGEEIAAAQKAEAKNAISSGRVAPNLFPTGGVRNQFADEKTAIDQSRDVSAQIKRTLTGGR